MRKLSLSLFLLLLLTNLAAALELTQITKGDENFRSPKVAPGYKLIAYLESGGMQDTLFIKPFSPKDGTSSKQSGTRLYPSLQRIKSLAWSPQGSFLAFIEGSGTLKTVTIQGKATEIAQGVSLFAISPDAQELLYHKNGELYLYNLKANAGRKILGNEPFSQITSIAWGKNGITVVKKRLLGASMLWSLDLNGRQSLLFSLTDPFAIAAHSFSPGGERICYQDSNPFKVSLWVMNKNGSEKQFIAASEADFAGWYGDDALFISQRDSAGRNQIYLAKLTVTAPSKPEPPKTEPQDPWWPKPQDPLPIPGQEHVFYRNSFDRTENWGSYKGANAKVKKGVYEIAVSQKYLELPYLAPVTIPVRDYKLQVELESKKKEGKAGLVFDYLDQNRYLVFWVNPNKGSYGLWRCEGGRFQTLLWETKHFAIHNKKPLALTVHKNGTRFDFYIDGSYLNTINYTSPGTSTKAGLWIASERDTPVTFEFDNFLITLPQGYAPQPKVIFSDDFSRRDSGWPQGTFHNTSANYQSGEYWIRVNAQNSGYTYLAPTQIATADYQLEVDLRFDSWRPSEAGLVFNLTNHNNFSAFTLNLQKRTWSLASYKQGRKTVLASGTANLKTQNQLKVEFSGQTVLVYLNQKLLAQKNLPPEPYSQGGLLVAAEKSAPADAYFDNFKLSAKDGFGASAPLPLFQTKLEPVFQFSGGEVPKPQVAVAPPTVALPVLAPPLAHGASALASGYPIYQPPARRRGFSFTLGVPLEGTLSLETEGDGGLMNAVLEGDEAFLGTQLAKGEAKPNYLLPLSISLPLGRSYFSRVALDLGIRGFTNPIIVTNEVNPNTGGDILQLNGGVKLSLELGPYLEVFGGLGLGKYSLRAFNKAEGPDASLLPLTLSGWSDFVGTTSVGAQVWLTPSLAFGGQYSVYSQGTISKYKYSQGGTELKPGDPDAYPAPVTIAAQTFLEAKLSYSF